MNTLKTLRALSLIAPLGIAGMAQADIAIRFDEGAPKDRFTLTNTGACAITDTALTLDLGSAQGKLIFDVTAQGAGVQVFQPFELTAGSSALTTTPQVTDGQSTLRLEIGTLPAQTAIAFTIDVDDTLGQREITVAGAEIAGATVTLTQGDTTTTARFSADATATLPQPDCPV